MQLNTETNKRYLMSDDEYRRICELVCANFGIIIKGDKRLTVHTKLSHRLELLGLKTYDEYINYVQEDESGIELINLVSHVTNNETYFFREKPQLDLFAEVLKDVKRERQKADRKDVNILSVGCSSGEETYSLNIITIESGLFIWDWAVNITGMDINTIYLDKARQAIYHKNSFRSLNGNSNLLNKYFYIENNRYILKRAFARNVRFVHGNAMNRGDFESFKNIDIIVCRNILIYMDDPAFDMIISNFYNSLSDNGYLFVGLSESLIQRTDLFVPEYRSGVIVYRKNVKKN